jgi:hypothetical protein
VPRVEAAEALIEIVLLPCVEAEVIVDHPRCERVGLVVSKTGEAAGGDQCHQGQGDDEPRRA